MPPLIVCCRALSHPEEDDDGFTTGKSKRKGVKKGKAVDPTLLGFSVESSRIMQGEMQFAET